MKRERKGVGCVEVDTPVAGLVSGNDTLTPSSHNRNNNDNNNNLFATIEDLITKTDEWQDCYREAIRRSSQTDTNPISIAPHLRSVGSVDDSDPDLPISTNEGSTGYLLLDHKTDESVMPLPSQSTPRDNLSQSTETVMLMAATPRHAAASSASAVQEEDDDDDDDDDITTERPILAIPPPPLPVSTNHNSSFDRGTLLTTPARGGASDKMGLPTDRTITDTIPPFTSKSPVAKSPLTLQFESMNQEEGMCDPTPLAVLLTTLLLPAFAGERTIHVASMHGAKVSVVFSCLI